MKKIISSVFFLLLLGTIAAQLPVGFNIDQISDQQLIQFIQSNNLSGLSEADLEAKAKERGLSSEQILKLKLRMQGLQGSLTNSSASDNKSETKKDENTIRKGTTYLLPKSQPDFINGLMIFGSEIFTKENLTFEPNLNIPTPQNYTLGGGDELKVDIYGFSDKSQTIKITPDGFIRYPNVGPIKLAGLSLDDAKSKLSAELAKIYPELKSGKTKLQLTLGQIRSIRVNLIGEITKPGTYSVSSLSTIANALYAAGGPSKIGSYRNIELVRSGKTIAQFDLYDYLLKGDLTGNKILQDGDVIKVAPYSSRIEFKGAVKRPALYELTKEDRLVDLLIYSGGLSDNANKSFYRVNRFGKTEREIFTVKQEDIKSFSLQTGDQIYIDSVSNIFTNRIIISGAVSFQGVYSVEALPTLKDLVYFSKPKDDAYKERAILRRLKDGYLSELIGFNLNDVQQGNFNLKLQKEDSVHIYFNEDINEKFKVQVKGEVNRPDSFYFAKGMQIQDAILMAGGYKDGAYRKIIEVARRIRDTSSRASSPLYSILYSVDLSKSTNDMSLNFELQPFDIVTVRKSPGYKEQVNVMIEGEVIYPGNYTISSNQERLSDLIKRAGGLKTGAYPEGAFLLRKTFENLTSVDTVILKNKLATIKNTYTDTSKANAADSTLKDEMKIVGIRLQDVIAQQGSLYDVFLQDGDIIKVPKKVETVQTFNGVYFPKKIVFRNGLSIKQIIRESGGVIPGAQKSNAYVVYPNGEVRSTKSFLFVRKYPQVKPGSEIYIPSKKESRALSPGEVLAITTGLATLATMVITLSNLTK